MQLFVGKRPIRDRGLLHALTMGYGELVPRGRYPVAVVHLDVVAGAVDINVHPQKLEVRFVDAPAVAAALRHIVQAGIAVAPWRAEQAGATIAVHAMTSVAPPRLPFDGHAATPMSQRYAAQQRERAQQGSLGLEPAAAGGAWTSNPRAWAAQVQQHVRAAAQPAEAAGAPQGPPPTPPRARRSPRARAAAEARARPARRRRGPARRRRARAREAAPAAGRRSAAAGRRRLEFFAHAPLPGPGRPHLPRDVMAASSVLIDQHAAHERVELERLRARGGQGARAGAAVPATIDVSPAELALAVRAGALLAEVGFEIEPFGKATLAIKAVPAGLRHGEPTALVRALLAGWAEDGAPAEGAWREQMLTEIACHSVVRAGDRLAPGEAEALLRGLDAVEHTGRGPHGRPLLLRLPLAEIARRFGR